MALARPTHTTFVIQRPNMLLLVDCSYCRTPLQLPPGFSRIRCAICHAFTIVASPTLTPASQLQHNLPTLPYTSASASPHGNPPIPYTSAAASPHGNPPFPYTSAAAFPHGNLASPCDSLLHSASVHQAPTFPPAFTQQLQHSFSLSHLRPSPSALHLTPPPVHGSKRAVICGVSYIGTESELKGCFNDARCMKFLLTSRFNFPESSILLLTEEDPDPLRWPTKHNIRTAMRWLLHGCQSGDSLVFHFSGHGAYQRNYNGDEVDGYDETLLPADHQTAGVIVDDEINETIVRPLPLGAKLHAIVDACHSGTMLDLPYLCRMERRGNYAWENHNPISGTWKGTNGGEAISFTGCDDDQNSADTLKLSGSVWTGAMTFAFIQSIERGHGGTYGSMLNAMRSTIQQVFDDERGLGPKAIISADGILTTLLSMLVQGGSLDSIPTRPKKQEPQLCANWTFQVYKKPFCL